MFQLFSMLINFSNNMLDSTVANVFILIVTLLNIKKIIRFLNLINIICNFIEGRQNDQYIFVGNHFSDIFGSRFLGVME